MIHFLRALTCVIFAALLVPAAVAQSGVSPSAPAAPGAAASPPEMPRFGKPGEVIHYASVALPRPKKSTDRTEGGADHVFFTLWIPEGVKTVRGIYHTPFNLDTVEKEQSRAMARQWSFALVGGNFMRVRKEDFAPSLLAGVRDLAAQSGHAELNNAPLIFTSMSAGVGMCVTLAEQLPERTLACGLVCLGVAPETERTRDVPMMSIFGEKDGAQMAEHIERLPKTRAALGSSWAIIPQWGRRHEWALANNLLWPFFEEVIRQRYPADASPADGPVKLHRYDPARVWLGDPADWTTIAPLDKYPGDKAAACWLPGEDVACVWRSFAVRKPLVRITGPAPQGAGKPLAVFAPGAEVTVQVECDATFPAQKIALYDRAARLAESEVKDGKCELRTSSLAPGFHTLIAHATHADTRVELSRPVTILVQKNASK